MTEWVETTIHKMVLSEKLLLLAGANTWGTRAISRLDVPSLWLSDGPNGVRGTDDKHGERSLSFPVGTAMGATFDPDLIELVGRELAAEARSKGVQVLLGPTVNIQRVPNAGRNFESFSEDPFLSGTIAAAYINGLQAEGVAACIKHFVANDQETDRFNISSQVDERTLREIYLEPFRIAIAQADPWAAMSAYNAINGTTASEHPLIDDVLRDEFGFDGYVISDWYGTYSDGVLTSGLDLEMPGPGQFLDAATVQAAIESTQLDVAVVDRRVRSLLTILERTGSRTHHGPLEARQRDWSDGAELIRRVGTESIVLLKNDSTLPLSASTNIAVIGDLAARTPHQGGGSSQVAAHRVVSILDGLDAATGSRLAWQPGCEVWKSADMLPPETMSHGDGQPGFLAEYFVDETFSAEPIRVAAVDRTFLSYFGPGDEYLDYRMFGLRVSGTFTARSAGIHSFSFYAAGRLRVSGDGAMIVDAWRSETPISGEVEALPSWEVDLEVGGSVNLVVEFTPGADERWRAVGITCAEPSIQPCIASAVAAAKVADAAVVVVGLTHEWEAEGFDRADLRLPGRQDELVSAIAAVQPNTVVVVTAGAAVEMPWYDEVGAVVHAWYGGQEVGHAVADVLLGQREPGGRMPITFPMDSLQHPGMLNFPGNGTVVRYGEGVFVGYRGFDRLGLDPRAAFGAGLSYTSWELDLAQVKPSKERLDLVGRLTNTGERDGSDVIRLFARGIGGVDRRLVGYRKVRLAAGASVRFVIEIEPEQLQTWDVGAGGWVLPTGTLRFGVEGLFKTVFVESAVPAGWDARSERPVADPMNIPTVAGPGV